MGTDSDTEQLCTAVSKAPNTLCYLRQTGKSHYQSKSKRTRSITQSTKIKIINKSMFSTTQDPKTAEEDIKRKVKTRSTKLVPKNTECYRAC